MKEEANNILCQRRQNGWSKKSIYTLKFLPKHTKQITKCHAFQVHVVDENAETLHVGWCVCVGGVHFPSVRGGLFVSFYTKHKAEPKESN